MSYILVKPSGPYYRDWPLIGQELMNTGAINEQPRAKPEVKEVSWRGWVRGYALGPARLPGLQAAPWPRPATKGTCYTRPHKIIARYNILDKAQYFIIPFFLYALCAEIIAQWERIFQKTFLMLQSSSFIIMRQFFLFLIFIHTHRFVILSSLP